MTAVIIFRLLHVIAGVLWAGAFIFATIFLLPSIRASGLAGGQVMGQLIARGYPAFIGVTALTTILSGGWMYWHNISISAGAFARSRAGMTYGLGGLSALIALVIGLAVISPAAGKLGKLGAAIQARGAPPSTEQTLELSRLQRRMGVATQVGAVLIGIAMLTMAIGRYV